MDKSIAGLLGAVGALAAAVPAQAGPVQAMAALHFEAAMHVQSYADLLRPIANAAAILQAAPAAEVQDDAGLVELTADHHHHHRYRRRRPRRHHHHHSQMMVIETVKPV